MAFWRKRIELPDTFYQAAGDCLLYFTESQTKVHLIETSFMSVHNACELLDLVEEGFAKLADLIRSFPVNTDSLVAQFDMTDDIQTCEKRRSALLAMPEIEPSEAISSWPDQIDGYETRQFQRSVLNMQTIFGMQIQKIMKAMAKAANINSSDFTTLAMRAAAATPRGQAAYAEGMRLQNTK